MGTITLCLSMWHGRHTWIPPLDRKKQSWTTAISLSELHRMSESIYFTYFYFTTYWPTGPIHTSEGTTEDSSGRHVNALQQDHWSFRFLTKVAFEHGKDQ